jgi:hypothetical protein
LAPATRPRPNGASNVGGHWQKVVTTI